MDMAMNDIEDCASDFQRSGLRCSSKTRVGCDIRRLRDIDEKQQVAI